MSAEQHHLIEGMNKKTLGAYLFGTSLCVLLTLLAFAVVSYQWFSIPTALISITVLALLQLFVQSYYFLGLNTQGEGRWTSMSFLFTVLVVAVLVGGSLWIMYNLNYNMMH